jgi:hypothetical protein
MGRAEVAALCIEAREFQVRGQSGPIKGVVHGNWTWMGLRSVAMAMAMAMGFCWCYCWCCYGPQAQACSVGWGRR